MLQKTSYYSVSLNNITSIWNYTVVKIIIINKSKSSIKIPFRQNYGRKVLNGKNLDKFFPLWKTPRYSIVIVWKSEPYDNVTARLFDRYKLLVYLLQSDHFEPVNFLHH